MFCKYFQQKVRIHWYIHAEYVLCTDEDDVRFELNIFYYDLLQRKNIMFELKVRKRFKLASIKFIARPDLHDQYEHFG